MKQRKRKIEFKPVGEHPKALGTVSISSVVKLTIVLIFLLIVLGVLMLIRSHPAGYSNYEILQNNFGKYTNIELHNGMKLLLVNDEEAVFSSAFVNFNVGYFSDPGDARGTARLIEKLLVKSKRDRKGKSIEEFVKQNGGSFHHKTSSEHTSFGFTIPHEKFVETLTWFSDLFVAPEFDTSLIPETLMEMQLEINEDRMKDDFMFRNLIKKSMGKLNLLSIYDFPIIEDLKKKYEKNEKSKEVLFKFYKENYLPSLLTGVTVANLPINELEELSTSLFDRIQGVTGSTPLDYGAKKTWSNKTQILSFTPNKFGEKLNLIYKKLDLVDNENYDGYNYFIDQLHNEQVGGFKWYLREKNWITDVRRFEHDDFSDEHYYNIEFDLTKKGKEHIYEIVEYFYSFLNQILDKGIAQERYEGILEVKQYAYDYKVSVEDPFKVFSRWTRLMQKKVAVNKIFTTNKYLGRFDKEKVSYFMRETLRIENLVMIVSCFDLGFTDAKNAIVINLDQKKLNFNSFDQRDNFLDLKYSKLELSKETTNKFLQQIIKTEFNLNLIKNIYIPNNFQVYSQDIRNKYDSFSPNLINGERHFEIWFSQSTFGESPTARIVLELYYEDGCFNPDYQLKFRLAYNMLQILVKKSISEPISAGYEIEMSYHYRYITISIYGFSQNIFQVFESIFGNLFTEQPNVSLMEEAKSIAISYYKNKVKDPLYKSSYNMIQEALVHCWFNEDMTVNKLEELTYPEFIKNYNQTVLNSYAKVLLVGNIRSQSIQQYINPVVEKFGGNKPIGNRWLTSSQYSFFFRERNFDEEKGDKLLMNFYSGGELDPRMDAGLRIVTPYLSKFISQELLQKKIELDYVSVFKNEDTNRNGFYVIVQGTEINPFGLNEIVEEIIGKFMSFLSQLDLDEMLAWKVGVEENVKIWNLKQLTDRWLRTIQFERYKFDFNKNLINGVRNLDRRDLSLFMDMILKDSYKLSYQVVVNPLDISVAGLIKAQTYAKRDEIKIMNFREIMNNV